jgi:hypothetical protein
MLQQRFCWGFILLSGWACIAPFCGIEFKNLMKAVFAFQQLGEVAR